jgi:hypothetical protein
MGRIFQLIKRRTKQKPPEQARRPNSSCQIQWEALGGVLATAASIARSKKIATATWWLQPQSEQQPRQSFASWPCQFLDEIALAEFALGASKHPLSSLAGLPLLICAPQNEQPALRRYFSLGKSVTIVAATRRETHRS